MDELLNEIWKIRLTQESSYPFNKVSGKFGKQYQIQRNRNVNQLQFGNNEGDVAYDVYPDEIMLSKRVSIPRLRDNDNIKSCRIK